MTLLRELERHALADPDHPENYELAIERLRDVIADRLAAGNWPPVM